MRKKLRICYIGRANSIHVERLMRWFVKNEHDISIITSHPKEIYGVKIYTIPSRTQAFGKDTGPKSKRFLNFSFNGILVQKIRFLIWKILWIRRTILDINPDIVHSQTLWYPGYLGVYITGFPFVITVLNGDVLWTKDKVGIKLSIFGKLRTKIALRKADLVTGESEVLINAAIKNGANKNKTFVSNNYGVDLTKFNHMGNKSLIHKKLKLPENFKIVLSPRNSRSLYNLDMIVKAIPKVVAKVQNVIFVFIWHDDNPDIEKDLIKISSKLEIQKYVKFVGAVNYQSVPLYHKASDVMVSVSQYDSGPMALKEAMACGNVPVISNLPSVRELITNNWNGLLVDPNNIDEIANSIIDLLKDNTKRNSFAERNLKLIQELGDQEIWMEKVEELYNSLINKKGN